MSNKKIITVFGATGAQGGGLVRAILDDKAGDFRVRAVTRDAASDKAQALAAAGAEIVTADVDDADSIAAALKGAYGAFFVTFFWDHFSAEKETAQAGYMAAAAKSTGLKHVVWSTLEDTRKWVPLDSDEMPTLQGKYKVPHFDGKGAGDQAFADAGVPTTYFYASFYWENLIYFGLGPKRGADGKLAISFPLGDKKMAGIGAEDIGRCAYGVFRKGTSLVGERVGVAGEHISCADMATALGDALGEPVGYNEMTPEQFRALGFPGADDLGNMFQFYRDYEEVCNKTRDVARSRSLNPRLKDFRAWLADNAKKIPLE